MQIKLVSILFTVILLAGHMTACNSSKPSRRSTSRSDTSVNTEAVTEHPIAPPSPVLSSQKGPNSSQVDLTKAQVKGDTLTIELQYKPGTEANSQSAGVVASTYAISQISVTDEATGKTYGVRKDQSGTYMVSPLGTDQGGQSVTIPVPSAKGKPVSVSFKFPAPPVDTKTISVTIPDVGTYKAIPLSR